MAIRMTAKVLTEICMRFNRNPDAAPTEAPRKVLPFVATFDPTTAALMAFTIDKRTGKEATK